MWEKINKVKWQILACMVIIFASYAIAFYGSVCGINETAMRYIDKVTDIGLVGAIAWLLNSANKPDVK